jgi:hypothetical protein
MSSLRRGGPRSCLAPVGVGHFVTRTTHEQWGWRAPSRGFMAHLVKQVQRTQDDRQDHAATATPSIVSLFVAGHVIVRLAEKMSNVADGVPRR